MTDVRTPEAAIAAPGTGAPAPETPQATRPRRRPVQTVVIWVGAFLAASIVVAALVFHAQGGRWFIVETPSMGTVAPVGTLVLTTPVTVQDLHVGDVISFHPPTSPREVYTHRIAAITPAGIATRGDINGAVDGWRLHQADLIGKTTTILPMLGWLIRGLPILMVGSAFVMLATRLISSLARRQSFRILGFSLLLALTIYVLRPFVGLVVLTTNAVKHGVEAQVVSTGILPITVSAPGGTSVDLADGKVGTVTMPVMAGDGHYALTSALHLTLLQWIVFFAICAIPLLWTLIVGLPPLDAYDSDFDDESDVDLARFTYTDADAYADTAPITLPVFDASSPESPAGSSSLGSSSLGSSSLGSSSLGSSSLGSSNGDRA